MSISRICQLLGTSDQRVLLRPPRLGASWEGSVIEQGHASEPHDEAVWATRPGAVIDLVLHRGDRSFGVEVKMDALVDRAEAVPAKVLAEPRALFG